MAFEPLAWCANIWFVPLVCVPRAQPPSGNDVRIGRCTGDQLHTTRLQRRRHARPACRHRRFSSCILERLQCRMSVRWFPRARQRPPARCLAKLRACKQRRRSAKAGRIRVTVTATPMMCTTSRRRTTSPRPIRSGMRACRWMHGPATFRGCAGGIRGHGRAPRPVAGAIAGGQCFSCSTGLPK